MVTQIIQTWQNMLCLIEENKPENKDVDVLGKNRNTVKCLTLPYRMSDRMKWQSGQRDETDKIVLSNSVIE